MDTGGPYLAVAALCERVLEEKDGVQSLIRMVDRFTVSASGPQAPQRMPKGQVNAFLYLSFKSGFAKGKYEVSISLTNPAGRDKSITAIPLFLEGDDRGAAVVVQLGLDIEEEGLYWINISLQDELMTRVPVRLIYNRLP
ncbi:MAG: hypothetical protein KF868_11065 [Acidobacteria bacterium]|nr:hypothetical protein [Acidobacteriota bacterium]MCW5969846.1 hypothetical protein [Blastocatellales bacterium]